MNEFININALEAFLGKKIEETVKRFLSEQPQVKQEQRTVRGLEALAEYLGVSVPTVARWKAEDKAFSNCYVQRGRVVIFDLDKVDNFMKGGKRGK